MKRPSMPVEGMNYREWKHRYFYRLLYWYLATNSNWDDWDLFCSLMYTAEQTEVMS